MNKNLTLTLIVWNADVEKDKERGSVTFFLFSSVFAIIPQK
jgi:hypothetical protein